MTQHKLLNALGLIGIPVGLFCLSFIYRWWALNQTTYGNGWDSYFYLDQVKHLVENGELHSVRTSTIYPLLRITYYFVQDYILSYKLLATIFISLIPVLFFFIGKTVTKTYYWGLLLGAFMVFSPHLTFFGSQYLKNTIGLVFLASVILALFNRKFLLTLLFLALAVLTHKLTGVLALVCCFYYFVLAKSSRKFSINLLLVISPWILLVVGGMYLERLSNSIVTSPSFMPSNLILEYKSNMTSHWLVEITLSLLLLFITSISLPKQNNQTQLIWFLFIFMLFPFFKWDLLGISLRITLVLFILTPLLFISLRKALNKYAVYTLAFLFICLGNISWKNYNPTIHDPNYAFYKSLSQQIEPTLYNKNIDLLIAHKSLAEFLSFTLNKDVTPWNKSRTNDQITWRLGYGLSKKNLEYYLSKENITYQSLHGNYFLIPNNDWNSLVKKVKVDDKTIYETLISWKNPSIIKPSYLK